MDLHDNKLATRRQMMGSAAMAAAAVAAAALPLGAKAAGHLDAKHGPQGQHKAPAGRLKKIGLEEHCIFPQFIDYLAETKQNIRPELFSKAVPALSDFGEKRLALMDANGVDFVVLSLSGPGVQIEPDTAKAVRLARLANDLLGKEVALRPDRYSGFAHLAMQDPQEAANELERCVRDLHFAGGMINGQTLGVYLDDRRYDVFWERVQALNVPIYIHPGNPVDKPAMYADHPELWGPTWSWAVETCTHALRLLFSGTFDRFPGAKIILGHMGETLPIQLSRLDSRYAISNQRYPLKKLPTEYVRENIFITTSGVASDPALRCALDAMGPHNVMFSIDYPFEHTEEACHWIETAKITEAERQAVAWQNAAALMRLKV